MNYLEKKKTAMLNYVQSGGGRLPSEYQEVEWIGTNGDGAHIKITNGAQTNDYFEMGVELNSGTQEQDFWGLNLYASLYIQNMKFNQWRNVVLSQKGQSVQFLTKYDIDFTVIANLGNYLVLAYRSDAYFFNGKCYYFRQYRNNEEILNLVPCYRKADGVIGMYDIVNDVFYTNSGSGTFTKGGDV